MLHPFLWLLLLSVTMLVGSFLFGSIPLSTKLSEAKLRHLTAIGVGLLIGTSLVVIIPEGIETLYSQSDEAAYHRYPSAAAGDPLASSWQPERLPAQPFTIDRPLAATLADDDALAHTSSGVAKHVIIGWALILGFAVMFVIDQFNTLFKPSLSSSTHTPLPMDDDMEVEMGDDNMRMANLQNTQGDASTSHHAQPDASSAPSPVSTMTTTTTSTSMPSNAVNTGGTSPLVNGHGHGNSTKSMTPTIGLIVHAAADGIALGASASHPSLSMVVFLAIMLHKGPSAFALTTVLLSEGFSRTLVRKHLLLFSLAAPTGAITTYILLNLTSPENVPLETWTGFLLVFSGGTFLFVAMHALQELMPHAHANHHHHHHPSAKHRPAPSLDRSHVLCIFLGMFLPVILNMGHSH
ncbi:Zinc/iron permease [Gongronella butleri]|nr:Zinc/iron permease [Gongronella butleri]